MQQDAPQEAITQAGPDTRPSTHGASHAATLTSSPPAASASPAARGGQNVKPKQKRNKPTLSCLECVERKTKCDRGRPCLACVKRQSGCEYTPVANLIASADRKNGGPSNKARCITKPSSKTRKPNSITSSSTSLTSPSVVTDNGWPSIDGRAPRVSLSSSQRASPFQLSGVPISQSSPSNVFGVGSQHPFANYWTCQGGLPEVISVLPRKEQADILVAKYFDAVDPVYPFIHRRTFYSDYESFWALSQDEKGRTDASLIALHYSIYALGTQFMQFPAYEERSQTAEFYCSAANQALRVYSYLNRTSMRAIQAMLLMSYFLMNDNHASDAYAWAGIHLRQTYALRLHRDPDIIVPDASVLEKQQRRKLWQAVFFQDTFLTILLKLPPTATHSDVPVESLADENELSNDGNDIAYMRSMWHLGNLVQENLSSPLSLSLPIANSPRHKDSLVAAFKRLYKSFPAPLTVLDYGVLQSQATQHPRQVRQNLFLTSNYYHCLMLLHASQNPDAAVESNPKAALEAAHEALCAFFKLWGSFETEAGVWWAFQHRAFEESLLIANLLAHSPMPERHIDPIYGKAKEDVRRMLEIMERYGGNVETHKTRMEVLHEAFQRIAV
ncbi:specific transcription factor-like protein [Dothistroma septosporum NZE10]|uniref:Specific transcription factor-like protein n=1 Tax=Dothistroma septosporum (strain NZE10 / CBS 128990) TaxID=675120 RepID=N1PXQ6_DOTSN|nr:specific transcription factor-like protein [Dothistroma septosporum NZE10]